MNSQFWEVLARKSAREHRAISLRRVSRETGVAMSTITGLADNSWLAIHREALNKLCEYFDCEVGDLLRYEPTPDATPQEVTA